MIDVARRWLVAGALVAGLGACDLRENAQFLVGRPCPEGEDATCDPGQRCLPHTRRLGEFSDFLCRDRESFERTGATEPPLAYCDPPQGFDCPEGLACRPDRIRVGVGRRPLVCKDPDDVFIPPNFDGGF